MFLQNIWKNRFVNSFKILVDFLSNNEWSDILMFSEKHDDFIWGDLDSNIWACGCVLNDDADERAHHKMQVESWEVWSQVTNDELE
jgi:hypothetical protein